MKNVVAYLNYVRYAATFLFCYLFLKIFCTLHIGNGQLFDNSPMGQLFFTMPLAFAQFEWELILKRMAAGKAIAILPRIYL